jgi:hypothetical protein
MRFLKIWLVITFLFAFNSQVKSAIVGGMEAVHHGDYTFLLFVFNEYGADVGGETYELTVDETTARFDIEAPGYMPNYAKVKLEEGKKVYTVYVTLEDPVVTKAICYENGDLIEGCILKEEKPEHLYLGDDYGFIGSFPVVEDEKLFACNFRVYVNGREIDYGVPVYLIKLGKKWHFEIKVARKELDITTENSVEIVVYRLFKHTPMAEGLIALAIDYTKNLQRINEVEDEQTILILQNRLKSNAGQLINFYDNLDAGEQRAIFSYLPDEGPLVRELKSKLAFAELYR